MALPFFAEIARLPGLRCPAQVPVSGAASSLSVTPRPQHLGVSVLF